MHPSICRQRFRLGWILRVSLPSVISFSEMRNRRWCVVSCPWLEKREWRIGEIVRNEGGMNSKQLRGGSFRGCAGAPAGSAAAFPYDLRQKFWIIFSQISSNNPTRNIEAPVLAQRFQPPSAFTNFEFQTCLSFKPFSKCRLMQQLPPLSPPTSPDPAYPTNNYSTQWKTIMPKPSGSRQKNSFTRISILFKTTKLNGRSYSTR